VERRRWEVLVREKVRWQPVLVAQAAPQEAVAWEAPKVREPCRVWA